MIRWVRANSVKQALREGRVQLGCSCFQLRSPDAVRALAAAGLDWVFFDAEHGAFSLETLQDLMRVATCAGLCPIVRVADLQYALIARALDWRPGRPAPSRRVLVDWAPP